MAEIDGSELFQKSLNSGDHPTAELLRAWAASQLEFAEIAKSTDWSYGAKQFLANARDYLRQAEAKETKAGRSATRKKQEP